MFKKALISTLLLLFLAVGSILYYSFYVLPKDIQSYEKHLEKNRKKAAQKQQISPTEQFRECVQKEIWRLSEGVRLHYQIRAAKSTLLLTPENSNISIRENLDDIVCFIQEKLYEDAFHHPMQQVKTFHADHGTYDFNRHLFEAKSVFLDFYTLQGHDLPKTTPQQVAFLKGVAKAVSLTLSSHGPSFHAKQFRAKVHPDEVLCPFLK